MWFVKCFCDLSYAILSVHTMAIALVIVKLKPIVKLTKLQQLLHESDTPTTTGTKSKRASRLKRLILVAALGRLHSLPTIMNGEAHAI